MRRINPVSLSLAQTSSITFSLCIQRKSSRVEKLRSRITITLVKWSQCDFTGINTVRVQAAFQSQTTYILTDWVRVGYCVKSHSEWGQTRFYCSRFGEYVGGLAQSLSIRSISNRFGYYASQFHKENSTRLHLVRLERGKVLGSYRKSWATIFSKVTCFIIDKTNTPP